MLAEILSRENLGNCESYVLRFSYQGETVEDSITVQRPIPPDQTTLEVYYLGESLITLEQEQKMAKVYFTRVVSAEQVKYYEDKDRYAVKLGDNASVLVNNSDKYPEPFELVDGAMESGMDYVEFTFCYDAEKGKPFGKDSAGKTVWVNLVPPKGKGSIDSKLDEMESDEDAFDDQAPLKPFLRTLHAENGDDGDDEEEAPARSRRSRRGSGSKSEKPARSERGSGRSKGSKSSKSSSGDSTEEKITRFVGLIAHGLAELEEAEVELSEAAQASFVGTIAHML